MIITINSHVLSSHLRLLNKVVPHKPILATLGCALLTAEDGMLHLYATDLEVGLKLRCVVTVEKAGRMLVPVAKLQALVAQFPDADVHLALVKDTLKVTCGSFTSTLRTQPLADFPVQPPVAGGTHELDAHALSTGIERTRYAVSSTTSRYVLQGALLTAGGGQMALVSTDSIRLALSLSPSTGLDLRVVVPTKTLDLLASHLSGDVVTLTVGQSHLFFHVKDTLLISRMLDGTFPAYERIIPREATVVWTADREALLRALSRMIQVADDDTSITFTLSSGLLRLTSDSVEGSASEEVPVKYEGAEFIIRINGQYVIDFLEVCSASDVTIKSKDATSAVLFTEGAAEDHVAVIMPMRGR